MSDESNPVPVSDTSDKTDGNNSKSQVLSDKKSDHNDTTNMNVNPNPQVLSDEGQNLGDSEPLAPSNNEEKSSDANREEKLEGKGEDAGEDDDGEDDGGQGVTTYSGYVPISQISWDWEPPTSLDNEKKVVSDVSLNPPRDTSQDEGYSDSAHNFDRKPVKEIVLTDAGEKAKPTPYIREIKAKKFEKRRKNKLFVGGLTFEATKEFLYDQFEKYGELDDACIVTEKGTGKSRGFGYVTFANQEDAEQAIKAIDGLRINGKTLCVEFADDPKSSPRGGGRGRFPPRGRGRPYDMDRYYDRDPYYDRGPDPYYRRGGGDPYYDRPPPRDYDRLRDYDRPLLREYDRPPPRDYDRPPPRDYNRPPPKDYDRYLPRDYDRPPSRDYNRPFSRDYYDRPPPRDYDRPPPSRDYYDRQPLPDYDDYRKPPGDSYDDRYFPPPPKRPSMTDVDVARLRVDREKVRREKLTSVEQQRLMSRQKKKNDGSSSSCSDSSDSEAKKASPPKKRHRVIPKAYMM